MSTSAANAAAADDDAYFEAEEAVEEDAEGGGPPGADACPYSRGPGNNPPLASPATSEFEGSPRRCDFGDDEVSAEQVGVSARLRFGGKQLKQLKNNKSAMDYNYIEDGSVLHSGMEADTDAVAEAEGERGRPGRAGARGRGGEQVDGGGGGKQATAEHPHTVAASYLSRKEGRAYLSRKDALGGGALTVARNEENAAAAEDAAADDDDDSDCGGRGGGDMTVADTPREGSAPEVDLAAAAEVYSTSPSSSHPKRAWSGSESLVEEDDDENEDEDLDEDEDAAEAELEPNLEFELPGLPAGLSCISVDAAPNDKTPCPFCDKLYLVRGVRRHMYACKYAPDDWNPSAVPQGSIPVTTAVAATVVAEAVAKRTTPAEAGDAAGRFSQRADGPERCAGKEDETVLEGPVVSQGKRPADVVGVVAAVGMTTATPKRRKTIATNLGDPRLHLELGNNDGFMCVFSQCRSKMFMTEAGLKRHVTTMHKADPRAYQLALVSKATAATSAAAAAPARAAGDNPSLAAADMPVGFGHVVAPVLNLELGNNDGFMCAFSQCRSRVFMTKGGLKRHITTVHKDVTARAAGGNPSSAAAAAGAPMNFDDDEDDDDGFEMQAAPGMFSARRGGAEGGDGGGGEATRRDARDVNLETQGLQAARRQKRQGDLAASEIIHHSKAQPVGSVDRLAAARLAKKTLQGSKKARQEALQGSNKARRTGKEAIKEVCTVCEKTFNAFQGISGHLKMHIKNGTPEEKLEAERMLRDFDRGVRERREAPALNQRSQREEEEEEEEEATEEIAAATRADKPTRAGKKAAVALAREAKAWDATAEADAAAAAGGAAGGGRELQRDALREARASAELINAKLEVAKLNVTALEARHEVARLENLERLPPPPGNSSHQ